MLIYVELLQKQGSPCIRVNVPISENTTKMKCQIIGSFLLFPHNLYLQKICFYSLKRHEVYQIFQDNLKDGYFVANLKSLPDVSRKRGLEARHQQE